MKAPPYAKPLYAWRFLVYLHVLYKSGQPTLHIAASTMSINTLRAQFFQARRYIETEDDKYLILFRPVTSETKLEAEGISQIRISARDNFADEIYKLSAHSFFATLKDIDEFSHSPKTIYTAVASDLPSPAWQAISFYVNKIYKFKVNQTMSASILLKK